MKTIIALIILCCNSLFADDSAELKQKCFSGNSVACQQLDQMKAAAPPITKPTINPAIGHNKSPSKDLNKEFSKSITVCSDIAVQTKKEAQKNHLLNTDECSIGTIATQLSSWECKIVINDKEDTVCQEKQECTIRYRCIEETSDYNRGIIKNNF